MHGSVDTRGSGGASAGTSSGSVAGQQLLGADVEDVVGRAHPLAQRPIDGGADLFYVPGFGFGELKAGQAAQVVVVLNRHAGHDGPDSIDVRVTNKNGAFPEEVVNLASLFPVRRPGSRAFQALHDTGDAEQDQLDLRVETASRPAYAPRHSSSCRPTITWNEWMNIV